MATQAQIDSFHRFASEQLASGGSDKSIDELYDLWRYKNRNRDELDEDVAAVQAAIDDMEAGDTGRDADQVEQKLREEFYLPATE